jgi:biotin operon repressor
MADLERLSRALKAAHAAGDTAAATKLAQAIKAARAQPTNNQVQQPEPVNEAPEAPTGDTSFGTAFKVGDAQSQSLSQSGAASLQRNLSGGVFGDAQKYLTENVANPVRETFGFDPIDIDAVNQAETKRLEKAADLSAEAAQKLQDDLNFQNLTTGDIKDVGSFVNFVSQKTAQALPYMGAALASGGTLTYPFGVGEISQSLDEIEGLNQAQKDDIAATGGAIMAVLENLGIAKLLPNGVSTSIIGGISKGFITEGTTEGLQELVVIGSEAVAGKKFEQSEIVERLKEAVAAGGVVGSSIKASSNTATKVKSLFTGEGNLVDPDSIDADQKEAAASVAKIIRQTANQNGLNLADVNASSKRGAKQALEKAHEDISDQIKQIASNDAVKGYLSPKNATTLDELIDDYSAANVALRQGKNKVKSIVMQDNYDAIMRLLPDSAEKTKMANLLKMSNQVTDLFNNGLKGGISQFTDYFNPIAVSGGAYDPSRVANIILGAGGAFQSGGTTLGIAAGGRVVDALTGRRSAVDSFTRKNERKPGLDAPSGNSLIQAQTDAEAAAQQRADQEAADAETARFNRRQMNLDLTKRNAEPFIESPQGRMEDATGLDRSGVAKVLRIIEATTDNPAILDAIASYKKSVAEGGKVKDLTPLIRMVNERVANNPGLVERVREPNNSVQPNVDTTGPAQPQGGDEFGPQFTTPQNYNRGIENNLQFNRELQDGATLDKSLSLVDRGRIITSLENLTNNLGSSPVPTVQTEIQKLQDAGVSQEAIDTYVKPYADRVIGQQKRNAPEQPAEPKASRVPNIQSDPKKPQAPLLNPELIPEQTRTVYKLMKVQKKRPGEILPLYAKSGGDKGPPSGYSLGKWYASEFQRPKIGNKLLSPRSGIHGVELPVFDQGKAQVSGEQRVWVEVEMPMINPETQTESDNSFNPKRKANDGILNRNLDPTESYDFKTNPNASQDARGWPIAGSMRPIRILNDAEVSQILRDNGLENQIDNSFTGVDATKAQELMQTETATGPVLSQTPNPLNIPTEDLSATNLNEMPSAEDIAQMREGDYKPENKRTLVEAVDYLNNKWQKATGRTEPFEYTPENVDRIASLMATEAMQALKNDGNAIGWYDRKLKAAKSVVSLVEPRVTQSPDAEAAFDFALAVTSNGQAVADNFEYALEVFRHFMDNGVMPTDTWIKGGERNNGMVQAFNFFNAYNASGTNLPIQEFLDGDYTVRDLKEWASGFNERNGTNIKVPSSEGQNETVKGSFIIGPKIGQGFYQNIRGNYDPLTMDIWWMRMWNRLVGRPFEASKDLGKNRATIREQVKTKNQDALEKRLTNQTLKELGIKRSDLKNDETLDTFVTKLESNYQSFFRKRSIELKGTKQKVEKPQLFKSSGTMTKNMVPQLQAQPKGAGERSYMRTVTKAAIEKLRQNGYMIDTADFQALMWYPEKQLFRKLGVAPGRGADNDYLDAAKMLALKEGFTDDQINQTLPPSDGDGAVNNQPDTSGQDGPGNPRASRVGPAQQTGVAAALAERIQGSDRGPSPRGPVPTQDEVKQAGQAIKAVFEIGKPGSKYEDGIKTLDEVRQLADVINVSLELFSDQKAITEAFQEIRGMGDVVGFFMRNETTQRGRAAVLQEGAVDVTGNETSEFDSYITALHEVLHGLADQQYHPAILNKFGTKAEGITRPAVKVGKNKLTGRIEIAGHGSFEQFVARLLTNNTQVPKGVRNKVLKEIKDMQSKAKFRSTGLRQSPFDQYQVRNPIGLAVDPDYKKYARGAPEMAVDPLIFYMNNPKKMKKDYPETAKVIKGFFQYSTRVQFFTHPLAMAMAVVMAIMAKQDEAADEEERRRMMPPPGALNQPMQPGALSA